MRGRGGGNDRCRRRPRREARCRDRRRCRIGPRPHGDGRSRPLCPDGMRALRRRCRRGRRALAGYGDDHHRRDDQDDADHDADLCPGLLALPRFGGCHRALADEEDGVGRPGRVGRDVAGGEGLGESGARLRIRLGGLLGRDLLRALDPQLGDGRSDHTGSVDRFRGGAHRNAHGRASERENRQQCDSSHRHLGI